MASRWYALYRPGREEPEAVDYDKSDLWSVALRRAEWLVTAYRIGRQAAIKRLKRRGWRLEPLPDRFWLLHPDTLGRLEREVSRLRRELTAASDHAPMDLLRELAEDRHKLGLDLAEEGWTGYGHTGTLRTCPDRLCDQVATLLGR